MDVATFLLNLAYTVCVTESMSHRIFTSTNTSYNYKSLFDHGAKRRGHNSLTFKVKACSDAHVALQTEYSTSNKRLYEIVLGGWSNTKSVIRRCPQCDNAILASHSGKLLSCKAFRPFWVSFSQEEITVGRGGKVGDQVIMSCVDRHLHQINYFAVSTGWGSNGKWIFDFSEPFLYFTLVHSDMRFEGGYFNQIVSASSRGDCSVQCTLQIWCKGFTYNSLGKHCRMFDVTPRLVDLAPNRGSQTWSVSLSEKLYDF